MEDPIIFTEYSPEWPALYESESSLILDEIGERILAVEHVGSTAVKGLAGKPIIDIMILVEKLSHIKEAVPQLEKLGYEYCGEAGIPGRIFFKKFVEGVRSFHLHCVEPGSEPYHQYLPFRDYLIAHPQVAKEYEDLKRHLAEKFRNDRKAYTSSKDAFVKDVLRKALS